MPRISPRIGAVIFAAGKGTRMYSDTPKVLQRILEEPMLRYVYKAVLPTVDEVWTVVGHKADDVRAAFPEQAKGCILQKEQLGTGHALQTAWPALEAAGMEYALVINGDTPLVPEETLRRFIGANIAEKADLAFITLTLDDPAAFGRVLREKGRDKGRVRAVIEAKDYVPALHGEDPHEINAGIYLLRMAAIAPLLPSLGNDNKSGEFYITDLVGLAVARQLVVLGVSQGDDANLLGVNNPAELVRSEEFVRARIVNGFLQSGVIIRAPHSVRIGPCVHIEKGVEITGPCELYGDTHLAAGVSVASHVRMENATVAENAVIHSFCHIQDAQIGPRCLVGPYARLRPGAVLEEAAHIGNFVEMKKARLGKGAKANHLSYLGDAEVGAGANIGAGTITCNYDGVHKHRTHIGEGAFIGSNSALVAPVSIGDKALIGAGSVITKDVPDEHLGITRPEQKNLPRRK